MRKLFPCLSSLIAVVVLVSICIAPQVQAAEKTVQCWRCGKDFVPDYATRRGKCPHCGTKYILPPATPPPTPTPAPTATPPPTPLPGTEPTPAPTVAAPETGTIPFQEAGNHIGETVTIEGRIAGVHRSSRSGNLYLNYHQDYRNYVSIKIPAEALNSFRSDAENYYSGKTVRATGKIVRDGQYLRQEVTRPEDLQVP